MMSSGALDDLTYVVIVDPVAHFFNYVLAGRELGYGVIVLSADPEVTRAEETAHARFDDDYRSAAVIDHFLTYQADDAASALDALAPWRGRIAGVIAGDEVTVRAAAEIGRRLGFDYPSAEDADRQQIKSRMKERLVERGVPTPAFQVVETLDGARAAWRALGGDCMIKMVDYAMSYGIARVQTLEGVDRHWLEIERLRGQLDHAFQTQADVVVEQYLAGDGFSVEGYEQDGEVVILNMSEKLTHANFMVVGHFLPAVVDPTIRARLEDAARACVKALGIRRGVFHAEIHIHDGEAFVIECAARPPGQYSVGVMKRIYGFDLMRVAIALACGLTITTAPQAPRAHAAIVALYTDRTGFIETLAPVERIRAMPECHVIKCGVDVGDAVCRLETFRDVLGLALLEAPTPEAVRAAYWSARRASWFVSPSP